MCKIKKTDQESIMKEHEGKDLCTMFASYLQTYSQGDQDELSLNQGCQCPRLVLPVPQTMSTEELDYSCSCPSSPSSPPAACGNGGGILKTSRRRSTHSSSSTSPTSSTSSQIFYFGLDDDSGCGDSEVFYAGDSDDSFSSIISSPCSTPKRSNSRRVSFADECGKDLVFVRVYSADSLPTISPMGSPITVRRNARSLSHIPVKLKSSKSAMPMPRLTFEQPAADFVTFMRRLKENKVCLENLIVTEKSLFGTIKVENFSYAKDVYVRCTFDRWASHLDIPAVFVPCCDSDTTINAYDTFSFETTLTRSDGVYHSIEFAICMKAQGREFWDNFDNQNYKILCDVWYDGASDSNSGNSDSSDEDVLSSHGNRQLSPPPSRKYGELPEFDSITGVSRSPTSLTRMRRNFCLY